MSYDFTEKNRVITCNKGDIVYDADGYQYRYEEKIEQGYVLTEIKMETDDDGSQVPILGNVVVRKYIYNQPLMNKKSERIEELENRLDELKKEIREKEIRLEELKRLTKLSAEEVIEEKLKDIPKADYLIKALTKKLPMYSVWRYEITDRNNAIVALDTRNNDVYFMYLSSGGSDMYYKESLYGSTMYETKEDAEKALIKKVKFDLPHNYNGCLKVEKFFEKYNDFPNNWKAYKEKKKQEYISELEEDIQDITKELEKRIQNRQKELEKVRG